MERSRTIGACLLLGLAVSVLDAARCGIACEPLPNDSLMAYRSHPQPPAPPKISDVTLTGVVVAAQSSELAIKAGKTSKAKKQKPWFVAIQAGSTEVAIHGMATLDYLRHGQIVEFSGQIVQNETVAEKVQELTIVAGKRGKPSLAKGGATDHGADPGVGGRIQVPKSEADPEILELADDPKVDGGDNPKAVSRGPKTKIVGRIEARHEKSLTVTCGERTIHVELADMPTIHVEIVNPNMIQDGLKVKIQGATASGRLVTLTSDDLVGSKIVVRGAGAESKLGNRCMAKSVEITLAMPLTGKKPGSAAAKKPRTQV